MRIWQLDKLLLFIIFVIPGFISIKVYELVFPGEEKDSSKQLVDSIAYSCINYALLSWLILYVENNQIRLTCPILYGLFYLFILFIAPIMWVILWKWIRNRNFFLENAPHPIMKPWDYVFSRREKYWIIVTFEDGSKIAGKYGEKSFTSGIPANEQIYLEETWILNIDGGFERPCANTAGIIITSDKIQSVELFKFK